MKARAGEILKCNCGNLFGQFTNNVGDDEPITSEDLAYNLGSGAILSDQTRLKYKRCGEVVAELLETNWKVRRARTWVN